MSGTGFNVAIRIVLQPSRALRAALLAVHAGIAVLALYALAGWWAGTLVAIASAVHCRLWLGELRRAGRDVQSVLLDSAGSWWVQQHNGQRVAARLAARTLVLPWILILPLRVGAARTRLRLFLLADNLPPDDFRRLRVRLLWQARAGPL